MLYLKTEQVQLCVPVQGLVEQGRSSYFFNFLRRFAVLSVRRTDAGTALIQFSLTVGIAIFASMTVGKV